LKKEAFEVRKLAFVLCRGSLLPLARNGQSMRQLAAASAKWRMISKHGD
jgi:hypothetical protein